MATLGHCVATATIILTSLPSQNEAVRELPGRIAKFAAPLEADGLLTGSLAVMHDGELLVSTGYGQANYELGVANRPATRFCVASLSKPITALAIARLIHEQRVATTSPVSTWIDGFPSGDEVTLKHLLDHTAGVPHRVTTVRETTRPIDALEIVERIKRRGLAFEPGTSTLYSTAGYSVVARIIEIVTERDYDAAMRDLVFEPLGMDSTAHVDGRALLPNRAAAYVRGPGGYQNARLEDLSYLVGGGSLFSTAADIARFGTAVIQRKGLAEGVWTAFRELGWAQGGIVRWNGKTNQFGAYLDLYFDHGLVVAFAGNCGVNAGGLLRAAIPKFLEGTAVEPPARLDRRPLTEAEAAPYVGRYARGAINVEIVLLDGFLQSRSGGVFYRLPNGRFFSPTYGCDVTFDRDAEGKVTALVYRPLDKPRIVFARAGG